MSSGRLTRDLAAIFNSRGKCPAHSEGVRLMRLRGLWVVLIMLSLAAAAFAAETTGSISGTVKGRDGAPMAGVTVTVSGPFLPAGRTDFTDPAGRFQFARLLPGEY